jgi:hypothetical protein
VKLIELTEVYEQAEDNGGRPNETGQDIEISTCNAGGGSYIVLKTERWAIDEEDLDSFVQKLRDLLARVR